MSAAAPERRVGLFDTSRSWESFGLDRRLFKALARLEYVYPTHVQALCLPPALEGKDLLVKAMTGSGKTLGYCLPAMQTVLTELSKAGGASKDSASVIAVILVCSKELVEQVRRTIQELSYYCSELVKACALSGKSSIKVEASRLERSPSILVATPSRLLQHLQSGATTLKDSLKLLVVDEADLVLSYGYQEDMQALLTHTPAFHQTLMMSATLSPEVDAFKSLVLHSPVSLDLDAIQDQQAEGADDGQDSLRQFYIHCASKDKFLLIYSLLKLKLIKGKTLFFVKTVDRCFELKLFLEVFGISSVVLNAELPFNSRLSILHQFNRGMFDYLIATDQSTTVAASNNNNNSKKVVSKVGKQQPQQQKQDADSAEKLDSAEQFLEDDIARSLREVEESDAKQSSPSEDFGVSRGLDFKDVTTVVNFDFPETVNGYIHRVGRTARGGRVGEALSLVSDPELELLNAVLRHQSGLGPEARKQQRAATLAEDASSEEEEEYEEDDPEEDEAEVPLREPKLQPLRFDIRDIEGFRYRVADVSRKVSKIAIKQARLRDIKAELLNSRKLRGHFDENPRDLAMLKHDRKLLGSGHKAQEHLTKVPSYAVDKNSALGRHLNTLEQQQRVSRKTVTSQLKQHSRASNNRKRGAPGGMADGKGAKRQKGSPPSNRGGRKRGNNPLASFDV